MTKFNFFWSFVYHARVFVEFDRPHSHSHSSLAHAPVLDAVYVALKRRQERHKLAIYVGENPHSDRENPLREGKLPRQDKPSAAVTGALKEMKLPDSGVKHIIITEVQYNVVCTMLF